MEVAAWEVAEPVSAAVLEIPAGPAAPIPPPEEPEVEVAESEAGARDGAAPPDGPPAPRPWIRRPRRMPTGLGPEGGGQESGAAAPPVADAVEEPDAPGRRSRLRTLASVAAWAAAIIAVVVVLLVFVFPTRTYLSQRRQLAATAGQLHLLDQQNAELTAQVARLQTDGEIERLAREQYHLVRPGEQAFAILPAPTPAPAATPPPAVAKATTGWWHRLTAWIP